MNATQNEPKAADVAKFLLRLSPDLYSEVRRTARRDGRSINMQIVHSLSISIAKESERESANSQAH